MFRFSYEHFRGLQALSQHFLITGNSPAEVERIFEHFFEIPCQSVWYETSIYVSQGPFCWKTDGAARNGPNKCIKGVSKERNETKLNYILVGRLCNLESPWVAILQNLTHPLNRKRADKNINNIKTKKNVKMLIRMWNYCTTLWFP